MVLDIIRGPGHATEAHVRQGREQSANQLRARCVRAARRILDLVFHNILANRDVIIHINVNGKRRVRVPHFVDQHAQGPVVYTLVVPLRQHDFWRHVLGRPAERVRLALDDLGESKVDNLNIAFVVDQQVFGLEVSVADFARVQVGEAVERAGRIEPGLTDVEPVCAAAAPVVVEQGEKLSPQTQLHEHVQAILVLVR